jgi:predicted PurR-regulated permease PerM
VAVVVGLWLTWQLSGLLLLIVASALLATLFTGLAGLRARWTPLPRRPAVAIATAGVLLSLAALAYAFSTILAGQFARVFEQAPHALDAAGDWLGIQHASSRLSEALSSRGISYVPEAASAGYAVISATAQAVLVVAGAVYLAAEPRLYRDGLAKLFPHRMRGELLETMTLIASALRLWFVGQLFSMVLVGVLAAAAFALIGLPIPLALGAIAGVTNFIPLAGPIIGAVPAVLFAFTLDLSAVAWTVGAIVVIQQVDGNIASPLIQKQAVALPPALLLFALVGLGIVFGWLGILLAAPLTVIGMVVVQKLWVREVIGEKVSVAGEESG